MPNAPPEAMAITAPRLKELGLIDEVIPEPLGGAHRDPDLMADTLKQVLKSALNQIQHKPIDELLEQRYQRLMAIGV